MLYCTVLYLSHKSCDGSFRLTKGKKRREDCVKQTNRADIYLDRIEALSGMLGEGGEFSTYLTLCSGRGQKECSFTYIHITLQGLDP